METPNSLYTQLSSRLFESAKISSTLFIDDKARNSDYEKFEALLFSAFAHLEKIGAYNKRCKTEIKSSIIVKLVEEGEDNGLFEGSEGTNFILSRFQLFEDEMDELRDNPRYLTPKLLHKLYLAPFSDSSIGMYEIMMQEQILDPRLSIQFKLRLQNFYHAVNEYMPAIIRDYELNMETQNPSLEQKMVTAFTLRENGDFKSAQIMMEIILKSYPNEPTANLFYFQLLCTVCDDYSWYDYNENKKAGILHLESITGKLKNNEMIFEDKHHKKLMEIEKEFIEFCNDEDLHTRVIG